MSYQDTFVRGSVVRSGKRECEGRYAAVLSVVDEVGATTVLDIGADAGYFSYRLAYERDLRVTAVDGSPALRRAQQANQDPRVSVIPRRVNAREILRLEHHDVVLGLAVLHHMLDWREAITSMRAVARKALVLEVPHPDERLIAQCAKARGDVAAIYEAVEAIGQPLTTTPATNDRDRERTLFVVHSLPPA